MRGDFQNLQVFLPTYGNILQANWLCRIPKFKVEIMKSLCSFKGEFKSPSLPREPKWNRTLTLCSMLRLHIISAMHSQSCHIFAWYNVYLVSVTVWGENCIKCTPGFQMKPVNLTTVPKVGHKPSPGLLLDMGTMYYYYIHGVLKIAITGCLPRAFRSPIWNMCQ